MSNFVRRRTVVLVALLMLWVQHVSAININTVPINNPGNQADMRYNLDVDPNGIGAVANPFRMGETEVTNTQYAAFLNAVAAADPYGLYNPSMGSQTFGGINRSGAAGSFTYSVKNTTVVANTLYAYSFDNKPVVYVSSADAMRFANWLHNAQPTGPEGPNTTETGAYTLNGAITEAALAAVTRRAGARWWLPNEDEWYKAAYHKNDGITGNYWDYPTRSDSNHPPNDNPPSSDDGHSANYYYNFALGGSEYPLTGAGAYALSGSPYGTFDQGGNVFEWNETISTLAGGSNRGMRGGSFSGFNSAPNSQYLHASWGAFSYPPQLNESEQLGFRVASAAVPEPTTTGMAILAFAMLLPTRIHCRGSHSQRVGGQVSASKSTTDD